MGEKIDAVRNWMILNPVIALALIIIMVIFFGIELSIITNMLFNPAGGAILIWLLSIAVVFLLPIGQKHVALGAFILATIWTMMQIYLQSSQGICTWPVIGGLLCLGQNVILAVPNLLFIFIPAMVVFGIEIFALTIAKSYIKD